MAITVSVMTGGANAHPTTSEEANGVNTDFVTPGIVGTLANTGGIAPATGGFAVNAQGTPDTTIAVSAGVAYVRAQPASQNSQVFRAVNSASANTTISANASGSTKYDWVYLKLDATLLNTPTLAGTTTGTIVTSRSTSATSDDGTPPTYGICIAIITVANGFSTITNSVIRDVRTQADIGVAATSNTDWRTGILPLPNTVVYNGNRSYTLTFNSVNLTTYVSVGMRLRTTRTVPAPTMCTSLNGTTQYYSKSSPSGMAFTNNFVISAWIKLNAYPASGSACEIASRYNGTSGWQFEITPGGAVQIIGRSGSAANYRLIYSETPVPLKKWVHVTGQLDMASYTDTATTCYIMIDGYYVPGVLAQGGSNPTSLTQAGNLEIGSANGGSVFFNGKIAQLAIFSAKVTQATMRGYMAQGLTGSETSLVSAYSFNNSLNDLNVSNANNLTAQGSAVATNTDSPFGGQADGTVSSTYDYATVGVATFSTNTTLTVVVPEGCTIPTTGGLSAVAYSSSVAPYGYRGSLTLGQSTNKSTYNPGTITYSNADVDLAAQNLALTIYSPVDCVIMVAVSLGINSTTDYEFRPEVRVDGTIYFKMAPSAALGSAGGRANVRGFTYAVGLTAGAHLISAGVELSSATGAVSTATGCTIAIVASGELVV